MLVIAKGALTFIPFLTTRPSQLDEENLILTDIEFWYSNLPQTKNSLRSTRNWKKLKIMIK